MRNRATLACTLVFALVAVAPSPAGVEEPSEILSPDTPWEVVDLAIVLDTSGSMHWLIDTARSRFWSIVQDLSRLEPTPKVRVAVLTYGNGKNDPNAGYVRVETGLTEDLDRVYERLFTLTSGGGTEYVARAVQAAKDLEWTPSDQALRLIFLAGNERADQDPLVDLREMADELRRDGLFIEVIFCGNAEREEAGTWMELAALSEGEFSTIATRLKREPETPFDEEIAQLSAAVNDTFLPVGDDGKRRVEGLAEQDLNAESIGATAVLSRALVKTSGLYSSGWDLVAALDAGKVDLETLDTESLPEPLREMNVDERAIYVEDLMAERKELAKRLADLEERRREHLSRKDKGKTLRTLDTTVRETLGKKLEKKGFRRRDQ